MGTTSGDNIPSTIGAMAPWDLWLSRFSRALPGLEPGDAAAVYEGRASMDQQKRVDLAMAHAAIRLRDAETTMAVFSEPSAGKPS